MDDPPFMRFGQGIRKREGRDRRTSSSGKPACGIKVEAIPLYQLHGEKVDTVCLLNGVNRDDVGVVEGCKSLSLSLKPRQPLLTSSHVGR